MLIYRMERPVEGKPYGEGPGAVDFPKKCEILQWTVDGHPCIQDVASGFSNGMLVGMKDIEACHHWFPLSVYTNMLNAEGFVLNAYEVPDEAVRETEGKQVYFSKKNMKFVSRVYYNYIDDDEQFNMCNQGYELVLEVDGFAGNFTRRDARRAKRDSKKESSNVSE